MTMTRNGVTCRMLGSALAGVLAGALLMMPMGPTVGHRLGSGSQLAQDSECGDRCVEDTSDGRATLLCDADGTWWAWLLAGQVINVPAGRCDVSSQVPWVLDADGVEVGADVTYAGDSVAGLGESRGY